MQLLVRDKQFYRTLVTLTIPMAMQNLVNFGVTMADTVMIGMIGEVHLSALSLANQLSFVFLLFMFGLGSGSNVMVAQYWGKGDLRSIHKVLTLMYRFVLCGALVFVCAALFFPQNVMRVFTTDEATVTVGTEYLRYVGLSYIPGGLAGVTMMVLRAVKAVRISLFISSISLVTNVFLNWVLIFGNLGAPALGVRGAAVTTILARCLELTIILIYMAKFERKLCYRLRYLFMRRMRFIREYAFTALPVLANEILWGTGAAIIAVVIGRMGNEFTAANAVCATLGQLVTVFIFGVANAGTVVMGNTVGAGKYELARDYAKTLICISLLLGIISSGVVLLLRVPIISLYNISETAKLYAGQIILVHAGVVLGQSLACVTLLGILRGGGDTRFVLLADIVFMWLICIPLGFITGLWLGWPVPLVYAIIKSDDWFKSAATLIRIARGKWINDITIRPGLSAEDPASL